MVIHHLEDCPHSKGIALTSALLQNEKSQMQKYRFANPALPLTQRWARSPGEEAQWVHSSVPAKPPWKGWARIVFINLTAAVLEVTSVEVSTGVSCHIKIKTTCRPQPVFYFVFPVEF